MLRELFQLAALFLVSSLELLMLHSEPLLLQHDLLVQTAQRSGIKSAESCKFHSKRQALGDVVSYSCSSVISFSLASSSSLRLLICLWWASLWVWICFSTASWRHGKKTASHCVRWGGQLKAHFVRVTVPWLHLQTGSRSLSPWH